MAPSGAIFVYKMTMKPLAYIVSGLFTFLIARKIFEQKKIFISFAIEDKNFRDLLIGQASNEKTPFEFTDMSVKEPWDSAWKTQCRERIKSCNGVIVLVSKNTFKADGVHWEIKCAKEERLPIKAIYTSNNEKNCRLPEILNEFYICKWTWKNIEEFIKQLN